MNKKLIFVLQGEIEVDIQDLTNGYGSNLSEISETIDHMREYGTGEIVDVKMKVEEVKEESKVSRTGRTLAQ